MIASLSKIVWPRVCGRQKTRQRMGEVETEDVDFVL
jgi:hypothetical protein